MLMPGYLQVRLLAQKTHALVRCTLNALRHRRLMWTLLSRLLGWYI